MTYANSTPRVSIHHRLLAALADPTRAAIYEDIVRAPKSVTKVAARLPVSRPAVSQHLKVLSDAGLVSAEWRGRQHIYRADPDALAPLRAWLDGMWSDALTAFSNHIEAERPRE